MQSLNIPSENFAKNSRYKKHTKNLPLLHFVSFVIQKLTQFSIVLVICSYNNIEQIITEILSDSFNYVYMVWFFMSLKQNIAFKCNIYLYVNAFY